MSLLDALGDHELPEPVRRAVEADELGAVVADAGKILDANDAYLSLVGFSREQLDGGELSWLRLTPAEWLPADSRAIGAARSRGVSPAYDKQYVRPDGTCSDVFLAVLLVSEEPLRLFAVVAGAADDPARELVRSVGA